MQCLSGDAKQPETNPVKTIDKPLLGVPECFVFNMSLHIHVQLFLISARMLYQANSEIKQKCKMKIKYNKMNKIKIR